MREEQRNEFQRALRRKQVELERQLRVRREALDADPRGDTIDQARNMVERELVVRDLDMASGVLERVRHALREIDEGTYGQCRRCEESIAVKRLRALPWSRFCVRCQEAMEEGLELLAS
ncbi:MAG: TraR/DksA family transcriptional regulator [Bryobacterales bacterium]|nr:TraR/DksA family transcriptional regulator [Bryobacterales bacterium]